MFLDIADYGADEGNEPGELREKQLADEQQYEALVSKLTMETEMVERANGSPMMRENSKRLEPP